MHGFDFRAKTSSGPWPGVDHLGEGTASKPTARAHGVPGPGASGANLTADTALVIDGFVLRASATVSAWLRPMLDSPTGDHVLLGLEEQVPV